MTLLILKCSSMLLSVLLFFQARLIRKLSGTWLTPAGIWNVGWFLLTIIPLLVVISVPINPLALLYILIASFCFSIPAITTNWQETRTVQYTSEPWNYGSSFLVLCFISLSGLAIACEAINLFIQGVTLGGLTSNFFQTSSSLISDRYTQSTIENAYAQIANIATYSSVGLGGLILPDVKSRLRKLFIVVVSMLPSLALMVIAGAKGTIFLCLAMFYGGFLVRRIRSGNPLLFDRNTAISALVGLIVLIPFVTIAFLSRGLYDPNSSADLGREMYRNFVSYSSAHIYAFSDWFSWYTGSKSSIIYANEGVTGGFYTFMSAFKAFGSDRYVPPGYYDEYFQYSWFLQTNIYTIYRGLIIDFTLPGSLIFMYFAGFVANHSYISLESARRPTWSVATYIIFCGLTYTSFLISIFVWSSVYPTFLIVSLILLVDANRSVP